MTVLFEIGMAQVSNFDRDCCHAGSFSSNTQTLAFPSVGIQDDFEAFKPSTRTYQHITIV